MLSKFSFWLVLASIFISVLATPAKAQTNEFVVLPGDVLQINVWKEEEMDKEVLVLPDGSITFPLIGTLYVRDMTPLAIQSAIKEKLQPYIPEAAVTVSVKSPLGHKVNVIGQVEEPGDIVMNNNISVMQALSQAGGLTAYADEDEIIIIRRTPSGKKEKIKFPYDDVAKGNKLDKDIDLIPGDVVVVPTVGLF